MTQSEAEKRSERKRKRKIVASWKDTAGELWDNSEKMLRREARREALRLMEDAARTVEDFQKVIIVWDKLEQTEAERIADHEQYRPEELLDWELTERDVVIPQPIDHVYCCQLLKGEFLDAIFDCPHEIQETTANRAVYELLGELDELHKELLYYRAIRYWSPQQIAEKREQTDRNIRKVYGKMIDDMRRELFYYLYWRYKKHLPITTTEKAYVIAGVCEHISKKEPGWRLNGEDAVDTNGGE